MSDMAFPPFSRVGKTIRCSHSLVNDRTLATIEGGHKEGRVERS
jgi:hypothetical protein